ncbi:MAG: hypothetical protein RR202_05760 [Bacteroidales bacterium]
MRKYLSIAKNIILILFNKLRGKTYEFTLPTRKFLIDLQLIFIPFCGISKNKKEDVELIITLTSYGRRVLTTVHYTLFTLLNQTKKPSRIILWLDNRNWNKNNLPFLVRCCIRKGVQIRFCEDLHSYKKLVPALMEFPESVLVTADDDLFYEKRWLEELYNAYKEEPRVIHCHRALKITFNEKGDINPYKNWNRESQVPSIECSHLIFPTTGAGVLFPPHSLDDDAIDKNKFEYLSPFADDIWFWAMSVKNNTLKKRIKNYTGNLDYVDYMLMPENPETLAFHNLTNGQNDIQIRSVLSHYHLIDYLR